MSTTSFDLDGRQGRISFWFFIHELFIVKLCFLSGCVVHPFVRKIFPNVTAEQNASYSYRFIIQSSGCWRCRRYNTFAYDIQTSVIRSINTLFVVRIHSCLGKLLPHCKVQRKQKVEMENILRLSSFSLFLYFSFRSVPELKAMRIGYLTLKLPVNDSDSSSAR